MSVQNNIAGSESVVLERPAAGGVYASLFEKINLNPVSELSALDLWQDAQAMSDATADERLTAGMQVFLECLTKAGAKVEKLDKSLIDHHIAELDYPPAQDRFHWRVLSHLGSGFLSMMDNADVLRGTLALYEWTDSEMNRRRLEAIIDVKHSETERFEQGYLVRGVQIEVTLDSYGFAGRGDICLFGEMLSRFFALYTDIYLFNRLIIILQPTGERLEWEEKHNRRIPG